MTRRHTFNRDLRRLVLGVVSSATLALALTGACAPEEKKAGLIVALQTDMSVPKDVDAVEIDISMYGKQVFNRRFEIGKKGIYIPATLTLLPPNEDNAPVVIRVLSYQKDSVRTLRRVVTTVPDSREALLRMPIHWLCEGQAQENADGDVVSTCKEEGTSCLSGSCTTDDVDSSKLPTFAVAMVFGGANADGKGTCFDTVPCMYKDKLSAQEMGLDTDDCTVPLEAVAGSVAGQAGASGEEGPSKLNFALSSAEGGGICLKDAGCFVPLDKDDELGWMIEGDRVKLPEGVCDRLSADASVSLVASTACPTKTAEIPTCGPWSSVQGTSITVDLGQITPPVTGLGGEGNGPLGPLDGCGDGAISASEACDDGNTFDGDGCSALCEVEPWYLCAGEPSTCDLHAPGDLRSNAFELVSGMYSMEGMVGPQGAKAPQDVYFASTRQAGNAVFLEVIAPFAGSVEIADPASQCDAEGCTHALSSTVIDTEGSTLVGVPIGLESFVVRIVASQATTQSFILNAFEAVSQCGDGVLDQASGEECDDWNQEYSDGCDPYCQIEQYAICDTSVNPSQCESAPI